MKTTLMHPSRGSSSGQRSILGLALASAARRHPSRGSGSGQSVLVIDGPRFFGLALVSAARMHSSRGCGSGEQSVLRLGGRRVLGLALASAALLLSINCGAPPTMKPQKSAPASTPTSQAGSAPALPPKSPLLAPIGEGLGSEVRALLKYAPAESELVAALDAARLLRGPAFAELAAAEVKELKARPEYVELLADSGVDPLADLKGVALFVGPRRGEGAEAMLAARVRYDKKRLEAYLAKKKLERQGERYLLDAGVALALPAPEVVLIGDAGLLESALSQTGEPLAAAPKLKALLGEIDPGRPFAFAAALSDDIRKELELPVGMAGLEGVAGWVDLSAGLEARANARFRAEEDAARVLEDLDRGWPALKKSLDERGRGAYFEGLSWKQEGAAVVFTWEAPAASALALLKELSQSVAGSAVPPGGAASEPVEADPAATTDRPKSAPAGEAPAAPKP